jgi:hypothetical protein
MPIAVAAYLMGSSNFNLGNDTERGDPAMAWVPPIEQTVANVAVAPFVAAGSSVLRAHYALIIAKTARKGETTMTIGTGNPQALSGGSWSDNAASGYSYYSLRLTQESSTYYFENPEGLSVMGYGLGQDESYYYLAAASARQLNPSFYINDIHFQDADGQTYCNTPFTFRAWVNFPVSNTPGFLRWYIDGVEETAARDIREWTKPSLSLNTPHVIKMELYDAYGNFYELYSTITVVDPVPLTITPSGTVGICPGYTTVTLTANSGPSRYQWYKDGTAIVGETRQTYNATQLGSYTVKGFYGNCSPDMSDPVIVTNVPSVLYWNKNATNNNWYDPNNWLNEDGSKYNGYPNICADVHIPGHANYYPNLNTTDSPRGGRGEPTCNDIIFHFGAEIAQPQYLVYDKAYIQYNFGYYDSSYAYKTDGDPHSATPLKRGRWYALAAPLKKMVTGDFSFGGYPNMWQQGFKATNTTLNYFTGAWHLPTNTNALELGNNQNYGVSVWAAELLGGVLGEDVSYHTNLNTLKGILEIPFFENKQLSDLHRVHSYDGTKSSFKYYDMETTNYPIVDSISPGTIVRGAEAYRFVFDGNLVNIVVNGVTTPVFKVTVPAGEEMMIGNPFMSTIDFRKFYEINQTKLDAFYRLYVNNNWQTYSYAAGAGVLNEHVAPLQAMFIGTTGSGTVDLYFPPAMISITREAGKQHQLRSEAQESTFDDVIYINAKNDNGDSWATMSINNPSEKDVKMLFTEENMETPQVYILDNNNGRNATQFGLNFGEEVRLGIKCEQQGQMQLEFKNLENITAESITLVDKLENTETNLLKNSSYKFNYNPANSEGRFSIVIGSSRGATGIDGNQASNTYIYSDGKTLTVKSGALIKEVTVTTADGMVVVSDIVDKQEYSKKLSVAPGIYIVKAKNQEGQTKTEKIVIK